MKSLASAARLSIAALAACSGGGPRVQVAEECNPLGAVGCITPWPSSIYEIEDPDTVTGYRLDIPAGALPVNGDLVPIEPSRFNEHDGFSPASFAFTVFPEGVDAAGLVGHGAFEESVGGASPTVLINMETGERVLHFAEVDANAQDFELHEQALYIRPIDRLEPGGRYAVGVRTTLKSRAGGDLSPPAGFAAIRAGKVTSHARLERVRSRYEEIFAAFEEEGISRDELVVAWDFTVASDEFMTSALLGARDAALEASGPLGEDLGYQISVDEAPEDDPRIARLIEGTFEAPQLVEDPGDESTALARDGRGEPMVVGTMASTFVAVVPACAESAAAPVPLMIFGHGFFGDAGEAQGHYMRRVAEELCMVVLSTEWWGMNRSGLSGAALALNEVSKLKGFGERLVQGIVNYVMLVQLARGKLSEELLVDAEGISLVDPTRVYFYGISQGHILGTTFLAYDPFIERGVLAVGGANWGLLFERSINWPVFQLIIEGAYGGALNTVIVEALMILALDPIENLHVSNHITGRPLSGAPEKQVLLHMAVGDSQVTNLSTYVQARALDVPVLSPAATNPWNLDAREGPLDSALVIYDEDPSPLPPETNQRHAADNGTHNSVRTRNAAVEQIGIFLETGEIVNTCDGPCDCAAGACD